MWTWREKLNWDGKYGTISVPNSYRRDPWNEGKADLNRCSRKKNELRKVFARLMAVPQDTCRLFFYEKIIQNSEYVIIFLDNKLYENKATWFQFGLVDRFRCHVSLLVFSVENVQIIGRSHS